MTEARPGEERFPDRFADAEASFEEADYVVYGVPYDRTGSFRKGAAEGPAAIRRATWNFELFHIPTRQHFGDFKVHDAGNVDVTSDEDPETMFARVYAMAQRIAKGKKFPLLLGGEHNVPMPAVKAMKEAHPELRLLQIDAHMDYRDEYEGERLSHANALRRFVDVLGPERCAILGVRSAEREELAKAEEDGVGWFTSFDIKQRGMAWAIDQALSHVGDGPLYLTIDIDGFDPSVAPGTGTPEPFGLSDWDGLELIRRVAPRLVGFDVVEVCPPYDTGATAVLGGKLVREAIFWREHAKRNA